LVLSRGGLPRRPRSWNFSGSLKGRSARAHSRAGSPARDGCRPHPLVASKLQAPRRHLTGVKVRAERGRLRAKGSVPSRSLRSPPTGPPARDR
jgi:hypothetical protein